MTNIDRWDRTDRADVAQQLHTRALDDEQLIHISFLTKLSSSIYSALMKTRTSILNDLLEQAL